MPALVPTLRRLLDHADALYAGGRVGGAQQAFEELVERAQERSDRAMQAVAFSMLARCALRRRDPPSARDLLQRAAAVLDPLHLESHVRYRAALARLVREEEQGARLVEELRHYLAWADEHGTPAAQVDAAELLAAATEGEERLHWLQAAADIAVAHRVVDRLTPVLTSLGASFDDAGRTSEALHAYEQALEAALAGGTPRERVGARWAVGAAAGRLEDWPLSRTRLEEAVREAQDDPGCHDLLALALADLAKVYEAAGDVIEARRLVLRAGAMARETDVESFAPDRWRALVAYAKQLELTI